MLKGLELRHFKCFEKLDLPLGPLTLLSGSNASGKSSALQALVLLHQTIREHEWSTRLMLNGASVHLGTVLDVVDKIHGRRQLEIGLVEGQRRFRWIFQGDREEMSMATERVLLDGVHFEKPPALRHLLPPEQYETASTVAMRLRDLTYITAERVGPREVYSLEDRQAARVVGPRGEHTLSVLYRVRSEPIRDSMVVASVPPTGLKQIEARMDQFFPGCRLDVQLVPQANAVTLGIRTSDDTDFHRPVHVGFGLTQVLPIVVAAVSAREQDILLIENPEVHLHPAGQAFMGMFLAEVAASGTQVIVETHSDHVLNGIRRTVKAGALAPDQALLHFFRTRGGRLDQVVSPTLDAAGNIDMWPEGFFDQFDKDMNHFAGWGE
jgi:predicted ATPase